MEKIISFFKGLDTKYWIIILVILVLITAIVIYYKNKEDEKGNNESELSIAFPLKRGSSGEEVRKIQEYILTKNPGLLPNYGADGQWGSETESAIISLFGKNEITEVDYKNIIK